MTRTFKAADGRRIRAEVPAEEIRNRAAYAAGVLLITLASMAGLVLAAGIKF